MTARKHLNENFQCRVLTAGQIRIELADCPVGGCELSTSASAQQAALLAARPEQRDVDLSTELVQSWVHVCS